MREGQESERLTLGDKVLIFTLVTQYKFQQKRVAALFDVNQGRIAEAIAQIESTAKSD